MTRRSALWAIAALASGCGVPSAPPATAAVTGRVLLADGTPLTAGRVLFHPRGPGKLAVGEIGPDGRFTLTSFRKGDGALPGEYAVVVSPFTYNTPTGNPASVAQWAGVPKAYWEEDSTTLRATVTQAGPNEVTLTVS